MPFERQPAAASWEPPPAEGAGSPDPMSFFPTEGAVDESRAGWESIAQQLNGTCERIEELVARAQATLQRIEQLAAQTTAQLKLVAEYRPLPGSRVAWSHRARQE